jgi:hypothetical protein
VDEAVRSVGVSQPKIPPVQVTKSPEVQVTRPKPFTLVPKRLVELAVVEKRLVVVAEVEVELMAVKFWRVVEPRDKILSTVKRFVR